LECQIVEYVLLTPAKKISEDQQGRQQLRGHQQRKQCQQLKGTPAAAGRQAIAGTQATGTLTVERWTATVMQLEPMGP
jgi:hypothetical protein